jgi:hypothetical protein
MSDAFSGHFWKLYLENLRAQRLWWQRRASFRTPRERDEWFGGNAYTLLDDGRAIRCNRCMTMSWDPRDVAKRNCGRCFRFHDDEPTPELPQHRLRRIYLALLFRDYPRGWSSD